MLDCADLDSVLEAVERDWIKHHGHDRAAGTIYIHLAHVLNERGFVIDTIDGLAVLEHCRRRNLPIIDVLQDLDARVRKAGYRGGTLSLADFAGKPDAFFVFFDPKRFAKGTDVIPKARVALEQRAP